VVRFLLIVRKCVSFEAYNFELFSMNVLVNIMKISSFKGENMPKIYVEQDMHYNTGCSVM
jgi:hypothetical protein